MKALKFLIDHFPDLLDINFTICFVILFVITVRGMMKNAPKIFSYALWGIVLIRLLVPISIESPMSFAPERTEFSSMVDVNQVLPDFEFETPSDMAQNRMSRENTPEGEVLALAGRWMDPQTYLTFTWLAGIGVMFAWSAISYWKLLQKLKVVVPVGKGIYIADDIGSPFVVGLFRPKIYLPANLTEKEQEYILLHEKYHIRRGDHIIKALAFLTLSIYWFNPFVWAAFILASRDMEMSCDEAVLKKLGPEVRVDYSASLLTLATGRRIIAGTPLAFGEGNPKGRIENIAKWKKPAVWVVVICLIICAALAVCLLTDPEIPEPELTIDFSELNTENVTRITLRNCHNGETTFITDQQDIDEVCAIIKNIGGVNGFSGRHYYEGSYSVGLYEGYTEACSIQFGDSDAFFHGIGEDGYAIRYEMDGLTAGGIIRLLSKYDESGFDWNISSTAAKWGVKMYTENAAASGIKASFTLDAKVLSADFLDLNKLYFGEYYEIQQLKDREWVSQERHDSEPAAAAAVEKLTPITLDSPGTVSLDWTDTYGMLSPGNYRLVMHISLVPEEELSEILPVYSEFVLEYSNSAEGGQENG